MACVRVLLAKHHPDLVLERLEPVLHRATAGQCWGHVIEMRLLQALAYQMLQAEVQALHALSQAVRLAEPEGYIVRPGYWPISVFKVLKVAAHLQE